MLQKPQTAQERFGGWVQGLQWPEVKLGRQSSCHSPILNLSSHIVTKTVFVAGCNRAYFCCMGVYEDSLTAGESLQWTMKELQHLALLSLLFFFQLQVLLSEFFFLGSWRCSQWHSGYFRAQSSLAVPPTVQVWHPGTHRHTNGHKEVKVCSQSWILAVLKEVQCFLRKWPWRGDQPKSNQTGVAELYDRLRAIKTVVCSFLC